MPTEIEATYRVVTPMFCGGANPAERAELRLPSFKGALRFWWRALAWSRLGGNRGRIRREEDALFGSAVGGQSRVLMRLDPAASPPEIIGKDEVLTVSRTDRTVVGEGARYLGYGVMTAFGRQAAQLTRACLRAPFQLTVRMRIRECGKHEQEVAPDALTSLQDALVCLGTLGGMGAKSRKGYGSLVIRSLRIDGQELWEAPQTMAALRDRLAFNRAKCRSDNLPEYTALTGQARQVLVSADRREPMELLDLVGRELMRYRSWGHKGRLFGQDSEKEFRDDHDLMKRENPDKHPRRIAFGLPHNYGRRGNKQVGPHDQQLDRRASPLFIHMHECDDTPIAVLTFLPARFLPEGRSDISVGVTRIAQTPEPELYLPINRFLDRLRGREPGKPKEPFGEVVEVAP